MVPRSVQAIFHHYMVISGVPIHISLSPSIEGHKLRSLNAGGHQNSPVKPSYSAARSAQPIPMASFIGLIKLSQSVLLITGISVT